MPSLINYVTGYSQPISILNLAPIARKHLPIAENGVKDRNHASEFTRVYPDTSGIHRGINTNLIVSAFGGFLY